MEWQQIALWALAALATVQGVIMKMLWTKTENTSQALAKHAQHDAETFVTKVDHERFVGRVESKLDKILDKLDRKADKPNAS